MAELVRYLDPNRRIYLLECSSMEVLKLDGRLQIVDRRSVFQGGPVDLDRLLLDRERNGHLTAHPVRSGRRRMARRWRWSGCRGSRIFLAKGGPA